MMTDMGVTIRTLFLNFTKQVGPVSTESAVGNTLGRQVVMTPAAGTVKGEFASFLFCIFCPVVREGVNAHVCYNVTGTGNSLGNQVFDKVTMGKVTVYALCSKTLRIFATMHGILPGSPKWCHNVTTHTKCIRICGFNHKS